MVNLPNQMQALVWEAPRVMNLRSVPFPVIADTDVLVRVAFVGICGSELSGYLGHNALRIPPLIMGHEFSGEVVALGSSAHSLNPALSIGQQVTVNPMVYCGTCTYCKSGKNHLCSNRRLIGAHRPGAFAEYTTAPAWMVLPLNEGVSVRLGALTEPVACAVRAVSWAGDVKGECVLVIGAGAIGLLAMQLLKLQGAAKVFIVDTDAERLHAAQVLGGEGLDPRQVDLVKTVKESGNPSGVVAAIDAVGKTVTRDQCIKATRAGGIVVFEGLHEETGPVPVADAIRKEITLQGSFCYSPADFKAAAQLLAANRVRLDPYIAEAPLASGGAWFEKLSQETPGGVAKVLLSMKPGADERV